MFYNGASFYAVYLNNHYFSFIGVNKGNSYGAPRNRRFIPVFAHLFLDYFYSYISLRFLCLFPAVRSLFEVLLYLCFIFLIPVVVSILVTRNGNNMFSVFCSC